MMTNVSEAFATLKNHICTTHVHDNERLKDSHLYPGKGTIDWAETMELLRSAPNTPPLVLEIEGEEKKNPSADLGATFKKLEDR
jgi:sugar phosphate isomerase/epimerase